MGDSHEVVVDDVRKVVRRHAVGLDQNLILKFRRLDFDASVDQVVEGDDSFRRHFLTDHVRFARGEAALDFFFGQVATMAIVMSDRLPRRDLFLVEILQTFGVAEAVVRLALFDKLNGVVFKDSHALALNVGTVIAADVGPFVPRHAAFPKRVVNNVGGAVDETRLIRVFDAQNKDAVFMPGGQIRVKRGAKVADVHITCGTGRETSANLSHSLLQIKGRT